MLLASGDHAVRAARRGKKAPPKESAVRVEAGRRDQSCGVGGRGWQVAPPSRFEEGAPPCQYDSLSLDEAGEVFAERYEGRRPLIVTGATANLPAGAFSRHQLVEEHGERLVAVGTSHGITASSGTGDDMTPLAKFVADMEARSAPFPTEPKYVFDKGDFLNQSPLHGGGEALADQFDNALPCAYVYKSRFCNGNEDSSLDKC